MSRSERQAGDDIEVTEEMIQAGVEAIRHLDLLNDPFREIAETVYRSMEGANNKPASLVLKGEIDALSVILLLKDA